MRRYWVVALAVFTLLGVLSPPAFAQAPTPKVTITGLLDMVTSMGANLYPDRRTGAAAVTGANNGFDWTSPRDREWYARTRFRPDFTFELGTTKAVMGLEIDTAFGQVSGADNNLSTATSAAGGFLVVPGGLQRPGTTSGFDLNTDTQGSIEVKWLYMEFDMPLVLWPTRMRVGAQPFATLYKPAVLAHGDFAGVNLVTTWTPTVKTHLTYVQIEEDSWGPRVMPGVGGTCGGLSAAAGNLASQGNPSCGGFGRGDDLAVIFSVDATLMKGLQVRPVYAFFYANGATSGAARPAVAAAPAIAAHDVEIRSYFGVDAKWTSGPWYLDPTYIHTVGSYDVSPVTAGAGGGGLATRVRGGQISAHFADIRGGWRSGPLLLELMWAFASGNKPRDALNNEIKYYQPINTDTSYYGGWAEILALGIDYFNGAVNGLGSAVTLDRFGRQQVGGRATYSWTPALDTQFRVTGLWTAREVDTRSGQLSAATLCRPGLGGTATQTNQCQGTDSYVGTEIDLGLTWRFAPGLTFDLVGAYFVAGGALDEARLAACATVAACGGGTQLIRHDADDAYTMVARVRYNF